MSDAARYARQSDPANNPQFSRLWLELPAACRIDREADIELQRGHHRRAEYLAGRADELRLVGTNREARAVPRW